MLTKHARVLSNWMRACQRNEFCFSWVHLTSTSKVMCVFFLLYFVEMCMPAKLQSCPTGWDPMDCSPPGSSVHGILQARILEWVAMPSSRRSLPKCVVPSERGTSVSSCLYRTLVLKSTFFSGALIFSCCCSATQSCLTHCNPMDCSTPGFPVFHCLLEFAKTHLHWVSDAI